MPAALKELPFHFDPADHRYTTLDGQVLPSITQMLDKTGWIDDRWYTEESSVRGTAVHDLTASYDMGALDPSTLESRYKGYVLAYVALSHVLRPEWEEIETMDAHPQLHFAGRPDRKGKVFKVRTVADLKTGAKEKSHQIQTALQAILVSWRSSLPPHAWQRLNLYIKASGRYSVEHHRDRRDLDEAYRIIKVCCR